MAEHTRTPLYIVTPENDDDGILAHIERGDVILATKDENGEVWNVATFHNGALPAIENARFVLKLWNKSVSKKMLPNRTHRRTQK